MTKRILLIGLTAALLITPQTSGALPVADSSTVEPFSIDTAHSLMDFTVRLAGFTRVRGTFDKYRGVIMYDPDDLTRSYVRVVIQTESVHTGIEFRDKDLKSDKFFDVETFPDMTFESERVEKISDGFLVVGPLTIRDVTREVSIPFSVISAETPDAWGNRRIAFAGSVTLNRRDYGVIGPDFWNNAISDDVTINLEISATIPNYEKHNFNSREKPSIGEVVYKLVQEEGADAAAERFTSLRENGADAYNFRPQELLLVARRLAQAKKYDDAITIMELLFASYPRIQEAKGIAAVLHEEMAKIYMRQGNLEEAANHCNTALEFNPETLTAPAILRYMTN